MDARVSATIALHLAKAELKVAELEALEKETPNTRGTSNSRLSIARRLRSARELAESWQTVLRLAEYELKMEPGEAAGPEKEFKAAPERIVAQLLYVPDGPNLLYCNRHVCYRSAGPGARLAAIASSEDVLADGGTCHQCGAELLA